MRRRAGILSCLASGCPAFSWQVWDALGVLRPYLHECTQPGLTQLPPCLFPLDRDPGLQLTALFQLLSSGLRLCVWPVPLCAVAALHPPLRLRRTAHFHSSDLLLITPAFFLFGVFWSSLQAPPARPCAEITPTP